jgi:hypothetical protein
MRRTSGEREGDEQRTTNNMKNLQTQLQRLGVLALLAMPEMGAWRPAVRQSRAPRRMSSSSPDETTASVVPMEISLTGLGDDHAAVGAALGASVQRWLDAEWLPQATHALIGAQCAASYVACRQDDAGDVMTIMTQTVDDLTQDWAKLYDAEAFVNAWDVANYVSDYLTAQSGNEGCACSATLY